MTSQESLPENAISILERFVVENDDLLTLEERVGRFNIFDALGIARAEIRHSNFLAWLLDPAESHGLGGLFLRAFLMDLLRETPDEHRLFIPIRIESGELRGVQVRREWNGIDLLITCEPSSDDPGFLIAIENKVDSGEHSNQLTRYRKVVDESAEMKKFTHWQFVFLTPGGDDPTEENWTIYRYRDLHRVFSRVVARHEDHLGSDVRLFVDHYLRLVGSRLMDDEEISELCRQIYKNHRQAIDLIVENGRVVAPGIDEVDDWISSNQDWEITHRAKRQIYFAPIEWQKIPPCTEPNGKSRPWVSLMIEWTNDLCYFTGFVGPCEDLKFRRYVIEELRERGAEFGFKGNQKITESWTRVIPGKTIRKFSADNSPDSQDVSTRVIKFIETSLTTLPDAQHLVCKILAQWSEKKPMA